MYPLSRLTVGVTEESERVHAVLSAWFVMCDLLFRGVAKHVLRPSYEL